MLPPIANLTVERQRATFTEDAHSNQVPDWTNPGRLTIDDCWIDSVLTKEDIGGRQTTVLERWWYGPEDADVLSTDRILDVEEGLVYEVDSDVVVVRDPHGLLTHKTCKVKVIRE